MTHSDRVLDHVRRPRNVGSLVRDDPRVGTGLVEGEGCGDLVRFQIRVKPSTCVIEEACFKAYGCGPTIAASSVATEWVRGRSIVDAQRVDSRAIVDALDLSESRAHASTLVVMALRAAIDDYMNRRRGAMVCGSADESGSEP